MNNIDLSILNEEQKKATTDTEGAVLVLAGAGSGKTRVLTHRIAYLILEKNVPPSKILAITFTNKATNEMKERIRQMVRSESDVWVSTFHSMCTTILRYDLHLLGYNKSFTIYNDSDSNRIIKNILKDIGINEEQHKKYKWHISNAKDCGLNPFDYYQSIKDFSDAENVKVVYQEYEKRLFSSNALDFDDLLLKTFDLFNKFPEILEKYQRKFQYIHVDEFQDTNAIQFELVKMLSKRWGNIFVVGDDDQSIYGWRGADIKNILDFYKYFPNVKIYKLLENYRSTASILDCANNVIKNNINRHEKKLFTSRGSGTKIVYYNAYNDYKEVDWVVDNIRMLKRENDYNNKDFAILVRANSLTRLFERKLTELGMSYTVFGGPKFFDRKEVQDVIAYLRILNNPKDQNAIERIINTPKRGIGNTTVEALIASAKENDRPLMDEIMQIEFNNTLSDRIKLKIKVFKTIIQDIAEKKDLPLAELAEYIVNKVNFKDYFLQTGKEEDMSRWQNVEETVSHIAEFSRGNPTADLNDFLETVTLAPEEKEKEDYSDNKITIATMHSVKGLEFKVVFIVGCEEETFPSALSLKEDGGLEEERRLMYVAVTRAQDRLYISSCSNRNKFNQLKACVQSRFVKESQGDSFTPFMDSYRLKTYNYDDDNTDYAYDNNTNYNFMNITHQEKKQQFNKEADIEKINVGSKIEHNKYGKGTVLEVRGEGISATATIAFKGLGIKKFALASAPLKIVD